MTLKRIGRIALATAAAALVSGTALADLEGLATLDGTPVAPGMEPERVVRVDAGTRWVNATQHEIVQFVMRNGSGQDETVTWHFGSNSTVDLRKIAPSVGRNVVVYLAPNPTYLNDE